MYYSKLVRQFAVFDVEAVLLLLVQFLDAHAVHLIHQFQLRVCLLISTASFWLNIFANEVGDELSALVGPYPHVSQLIWLICEQISKLLVTDADWLGVPYAENTIMWPELLCLKHR